jgi:hypothetical protein
MRPAIDTLTPPFIHVAFDQIASIIAKSTYPYRGQTRLSLTVRCPCSTAPRRRPNTRTTTVMSIPGPRGSIPMTREVDAPPDRRSGMVESLMSGMVSRTLWASLRGSRLSRFLATSR